MNTITIGLIGLGSIGNVHKDVLTGKSSPDLFELVAVCDTTPKPTNLPFYEDYRAFLAHPGLQAISIATPLHYDLPYKQSRPASIYSWKNHRRLLSNS